MLEETNASGAAQADYIYLDDKPIATLDPSTGALYFLNDDLLGTPQVASDSSQTIQWQATYEPFGTASVSGTLTQNLRFPGQYFDAESGWNHNGFRNYIPDLGRYAEPEPLALEGSAIFYNPLTGLFLSDHPAWFHAGIDIYVYVGNDPTDFEDPFGLQSNSAPYEGEDAVNFEFGKGAGDMWRNYQRMEQRQWIGADKYYHCMANCQATNEGPGGAVAAKVISFFRTDVVSRFREPTDWRNDDVANHCGQKGGDCQKRCAPFIPRSSPGRRPFPGW